MDYPHSKYLAHQREWLKARLERIRDTESNAGGQSASDVRRQIAGIHIALRRIEEGTYGLCMPCGCPIEEGILEIEPEAVICRACKATTKWR